MVSRNKFFNSISIQSLYDRKINIWSLCVFIYKYVDYNSINIGRNLLEKKKYHFLIKLFNYLSANSI